MPHLRILTNVDKSKFDEVFMNELISTMATLSGKPEKKIMLSISANDLMMFAGTTEPTAFVTFIAIGKIGVDYNPKYAEALFQALDQKGIPRDRVYVEFREIQLENVAHGGAH